MAVHRRRKQATVMVAGKINLWPCRQRPRNPRTQPVIRQQAFRYVGNQNRVADIRVPRPDFFHSQVIGQMTRADDLDAVVENENPDRRTHEVVTMNECINPKSLNDDKEE